MLLFRPRSVGGLLSLVHLDVSHNSLHHLATQLSCLLSLTHLEASDNKLHQNAAVPEELSTLRALKVCLMAWAWCPWATEIYVVAAATSESEVVLIARLLTAWQSLLSSYTSRGAGNPATILVASVDDGDRCASCFCRSFVWRATDCNRCQRR